MILLTGATDGIGLHTARALAKDGRPLIIHGRNQQRLEALSAELQVEHERADLSSLGEVHALVERLRRFESLTLINNAGVGPFANGGTRGETKDGFELCWGVNFLAAFALTEGLARAGVKLDAVVNVASVGQSPVDVKDPNLEKKWDPWGAYRQSKLAMIAWTFERARRVPSVPITALHPGTFLATKMVEEASVAPMGEAKSGAEAICFVLDRTLAGTSGVYFDVKREARANAQATDVAFQAWLRDYAEHATTTRAH